MFVDKKPIKHNSGTNRKEKDYIVTRTGRP